MKIKAADFEALSNAVRPYLTPERQAEYLDAGLTMERYRWDALHASGFDTRALYVYLNDSHISTALKAALPELRQEIGRCRSCDRTICAGGSDSNCSECEHEECDGDCAECSACVRAGYRVFDDDDSNRED